MTKKTSKGWEKDLEELPAVNYNLYIGSGSVSCDNCLKFEEALKQLKQFIQSLLKKQVEEIENYAKTRRKVLAQRTDKRASNDGDYAMGRAFENLDLLAFLARRREDK